MGAASAQTHQHHGASEEEALPVLCAICPASREADGTSWQPDAAAAHPGGWTFGDWRVMAHLQVAAVATRERGPRGDDKVFSTNYGMVKAWRRAGAGVVGLSSMWTLEPAMGRRGYPLLLQTGETADGVTPLTDRQHPHDLPMELAVTYSRPIGVERALFVYAAAVGAPALGPPAFMHRASASRLPISPITHHWFDATHVTYGVVTFGVAASPAFKMEASAFRGREPDQDRWGFETPGLDSYSFRLSVNPSPYVALQISGGHLEDPEVLHPGANLTRLTASLMYSRPWRGGAIDAMAAWGRNKRSPSSFPVPGGIFFMPGGVAQAGLVEAAVRPWSRHAILGRVERATKDELFGLDDPRHVTRYPVTRLTTGYAFDALQLPRATVSIGGALSWNWMDEEIQPDYGGSPRALLGFVQLRTH